MNITSIFIALFLAFHISVAEASKGGTRNMNENNEWENVNHNKKPKKWKCKKMVGNYSLMDLVLEMSLPQWWKNRTSLRTFEMISMLLSHGSWTWPTILLMVNKTMMSTWRYDLFTTLNILFCFICTACYPSLAASNYEWMAVNKRSVRFGSCYL